MTDLTKNKNKITVRTTIETGCHTIFGNRLILKNYLQKVRVSNFQTIKIK